MKELNNYIDTINQYLETDIRQGKNWASAVKNLSDYLNAHDFVQHEGMAINDDTVDAFISRIQNENNNHNLNFLPDNKLEVQPMAQQQPNFNPLADLLERQISVQNLLDIYNRYAPVMMSMQEVQRNSGGNPDNAKAYLIRQILTHAYDGTLVARGFGIKPERKGMNELARIVLDLQRDVTRVKNAISPHGAEEIVNKHNATARPGARWKLNKRDPNAPASLTNLTDINHDGVPDVVITNGENHPIFVNGYTTKQTQYPVDLAYYNQYPTRASRHGHPYDQFKDELFNTTYDVDNEDFSKRGDVTSFQPNLDLIQGYDTNLYHIPQPHRMTSFARFKKFVIGDILNRVLERLEVPASRKLALTSKAAAAAWNHYILRPIFERYNATTPQAQARIKKRSAHEIDEAVNNMYAELQNNNDTVNALANVLANAINGQ